MLTKTKVALIAASLLLTPFGVAYAADDAKDKAGTEMKAPKDNASEWTKEDAMKNGVSEQQFTAADKNHDGKLDKSEITGAGLQPKEKTSK